MNEYVIHARVKNNLILARILERYPTVNAFCAASGLTPTDVGRYVNMKGRAYNPKSGQWTQTALKLAEALDVTVDELFTDEQRVAQLRSNEAYVEMSRQQALAMTDPVALLENKNLVLRMMEHAHLTDREVKVLAMRFNQDMTLEEVGQAMGLTGNGVRQIEAKALRRLRHPRVRDVMVEAGVINDR